MPEFTSAEARAVLKWLAAWAQDFEARVDGPLRAQLRGVRPAEVAELLGQLALAQKQLETRAKPVRVHEQLGPLLKRVLVEQRRACAEASEEPMQKVVHSAVGKQLLRDLRSVEHLLEAPWIAQCKALRVPRVTDYLSIQHAEAADPQRGALAPREFDEKFHILEAPSLFLPDLAVYRRRCAVRELSLGVAYLDIDDFKSLNTRYTETVVDALLLPRFMEALEAHVFAHGHAYRFGGDEYVLTLPNADADFLARFLHALQARLARLHVQHLTAAPTVSIGACSVEPDCALTDREVLQRANEAKRHAKLTRKGSVCAYASPALREGDFVLLEPPRSP